MVKSLMSFFWDFAPRLVPTGIWKDVRLVGTRGARLHSPRLDCELSGGNAAADLAFTTGAWSAAAQDVMAVVELFEPGAPHAVLACRAPVSLAAGENELTLAGTLVHPRPWWPNGLGDPFHDPVPVGEVGGNELFMPQSGMGPQDRTVRMLGSVAWSLDPGRIFLPSSPYLGVFHGPYTFDCFGQGGYGSSVNHVQFCNTAPRWPNVPGTMPWCFNTPWTSFAGSFVVAYPDAPLPAYHALQKAYAPRSVSARLQSFVARPGETVRIGVHVLNDSGAPVGPGLVRVEAGPVGGEPWVKRTLDAPGVQTMGRAVLGDVSVGVPASFEGVLTIALHWRHAEGGESNRSFVGVKAGAVAASHPACFRPLLALWERDPAARLPAME
jgi:hypothetical protein